jgi:hypothetical protein
MRLAIWASLLLAVFLVLVFGPSEDDLFGDEMAALQRGNERRKMLAHQRTLELAEEICGLLHDGLKV